MLWRLVVWGMLIILQSLQKSVHSWLPFAHTIQNDHWDGRPSRPQGKLCFLPAEVEGTGPGAGTADEGVAAAAL